MSTATEIRDAAPDEPVEVEHPVTPLELFFDLVFVLAFTQVTAAMADDPSWGGLARGMLVLATVWWAWVGYAWLTNAIDPEEGWPRLLMFVAMAAMLVVALAVPGSVAFAGEFLILAGVYGVGWGWAVVGAAAIVLAAMYVLRLISAVLHTVHGADVRDDALDIRPAELALLVPLVGLLLFLSAWPASISERSFPPTDTVEASE